MDMIKNLGTNIMSGKKITGLSLPVRIFEPRSTIERIADAFHYLPHFLERAVKGDTQERIKCLLSAIGGAQV